MYHLTVSLSNLKQGNPLVCVLICLGRGSTAIMTTKQKEGRRICTRVISEIFCLLYCTSMPLSPLLCRTYLPLACAIFKYARGHHGFALHFAGDNSGRDRNSVSSRSERRGYPLLCSLLLVWCFILQYWINLFSWDDEIMSYLTSAHSAIRR